MTEKELQERQVPQSRILSQPERRSGGFAKQRFSLVLLLAGIVILLGGGSVLLWQIVAHQGNGNNTPPVVQVKSPGANSCQSRLPWNIIQQEFAGELHLSIEQIEGKIRAGKKIQEIATGQGFSQAQLHTIEIHAYSVGNEQWKSQGCLTQQDFASNQQRYSSETQQMLNDDFTSLFT